MYIYQLALSCPTFTVFIPYLDFLGSKKVALHGLAGI